MQGPWKSFQESSAARGSTAARVHPRKDPSSLVPAGQVRKDRTSPPSSRAAWTHGFPQRWSVWEGFEPESLDLPASPKAQRDNSVPRRKLGTMERTSGVMEVCK